MTPPEEQTQTVLEFPREDWRDNTTATEVPVRPADPPGRLPDPPDFAED